MNEFFVNMAEPYKPNNMGSSGKAKFMLIAQNNFPLSYDGDKDKIISAYLDRIQGYDKLHISDCFKKFNFNERSFESYFKEKSPKVVLSFICELLHQDCNIYTGYRITGMVGGNSYPYYLFELFSKHPETDTEVYSGHNAPNIQH